MTTEASAPGEEPETATKGGNMNFLREKFGIYGLGFKWDSFLGLMIPLGFVVVVGAIGAALVTNGFGGLIPLP